MRMGQTTPRSIHLEDYNTVILGLFGTMWTTDETDQPFLKKTSIIINKCADFINILHSYEDRV